MRVLIQRVTEASVSIGGQLHSRIGSGMLVLLGVAEDDTQEDIDWLCGKISRLRIFNDAAGVMNLSLDEVGGELCSAGGPAANRCKGRRLYD